MLAALVVALALVHPKPVWVDCSHRADVRPAGIVIACGDGNFWLNRLTWKTWGAKSATATGVGHLNDCTPYCYSGHFHAYRISIRFSDVVTCGGTRPEYARITWRWSRPKPAWFHSDNWNGSDTLSCSWLRMKP